MDRNPMAAPSGSRGDGEAWTLWRGTADLPGCAVETAGAPWGTWKKQHPPGAAVTPPPSQNWRQHLTGQRLGPRPARAARLRGSRASLPAAESPATWRLRELARAVGISVPDGPLAESELEDLEVLVRCSAEDWFWGMAK